MKAQQEYESLTERIEAQKEKKLNRFIAALAAVIQESDEEPAKDTSSEEDDEDIVLISLFSLRIKTECELIREGSRDLVEQVKEDIEELVSHVQSFEYESTISEMVRSDAYDTAELQLEFTVESSCRHSSGNVFSVHEYCRIYAKYRKKRRSCQSAGGSLHLQSKTWE